MIAMLVSDYNSHNIIERWRDGFEFDWVAEDGLVILFDGEARMF